MPEPAANGADGSPSSPEFAELHRLLVGPEAARIAALEARLEDSDHRAADVASVLPEAIRTAKAKALREALEPVFEKAFESSVRKHPQALADAIFPVIGPAIRKSIAASIAEFAETLNQIVEKSVSFRSIQWRVEALLTGKPFSQILLARSLLYSVEQVFLIHRKSGLLLLHVAAKGSVLKDADMISGMLTAIQDFFSDSFTEGGQDLETVDTGRFRLWIQYGPHVLLAGAVSGTAPAELKGVFREAIDKVEEMFGGELGRFKQDDLSVFEPARPLLEACLLGQSGPGAKRRTWPLWALAGLVILAIAAFTGYRIREKNRWDAWFDSLKRQPGIVVTGIEKRGADYVVSGLRDPLASDPKHAGVRFAWQPYLSLDAAFTKQREFEAAKQRLEEQLIRFDAGSSRLSMSEANRIDDAGTAIERVLRLRPSSRITITGRADETGSADMNDKLSMDRAKHVIEALVIQGVAQDRLAPAAMGNTQPLRKGASDWDRATNRSVSFQVHQP
ncbi:MAG: OmpA family protein [Acidobacteriota bacterium]